MAVRFNPFSRLRKREKVLVSLAAALLLVYLVAVTAVIPALRRYRLDGEMLADKERILEGYRETVAREKELKARVDALKGAAGSYDQYLLKSDKPSLAAAELQNRIKEAAVTYGLDIASEKIGNPTKGETAVLIPVEITTNGNIRSIKEFLYDIETGRPLLSIPEITVRSNRRRTYDAAAKKYVDVEELQATILVHGMMKGGI